jgi:predicted amidohydrolase YtcJ
VATLPPGGIIMKNEITGEPNGILLENAGDILWAMAMDPSEYSGLKDVAYEGLQWSLKQIAKNGITSICDARWVEKTIIHNSKIF